MHYVFIGRRIGFQNTLYVTEPKPDFSAKTYTSIQEIKGP